MRPPSHSSSSPTTPLPVLAPVSLSGRGGICKSRLQTSMTSFNIRLYTRSVALCHLSMVCIRLAILCAGEIVDGRLLLGIGLRLDLGLASAGGSPGQPLRSLLPDRATAAERGLRGRDLCLGFGELVQTGTSTILAGSADLCPLRPAGFNTRTKLGEIQHHKKDSSMLEFAVPQSVVGVLLHGKGLHVFGGHAVGCHSEVVLVDAGKTTELAPQPLSLLLALLWTVMLPRSHEFEVAFTNAMSHSVDMLVSPDVGILNYTDPSLRQHNVFFHVPDGPLPRHLVIILLGPRRTRGRGRAPGLSPASGPPPFFFDLPPVGCISRGVSLTGDSPTPPTRMYRR